MKTISRNIYFYKINAGFKNSGIPVDLDLHSIFERIDKIPLDNPDRYMPFNGRHICCWVIEKEFPMRIILGNIRTDTFPLLVKKGHLSPLQIPDGSEMAENIHIVIFKDYTIGFEYNSFGPRISSLADYVNTKAYDTSKQYITVDPLIQQDQITRILKLNRISSFTLRIKPGFVQIDKYKKLPLMRALDLCQGVGGADSLEITYKASRKIGAYLSPDLLQSAVEIAKEIDSDMMVEKLQLKGLNTETMEEININLLNTKVMSKKQIMRLDSNCKALDSSDAFMKIEQSYNDLGNEIERAYLVSNV
jgi:hypothetical protein